MGKSGVGNEMMKSGHFGMIFNISPWLCAHVPLSNINVDYHNIVLAHS